MSIAASRHVKTVHGRYRHVDLSRRWDAYQSRWRWIIYWFKENPTEAFCYRCYWEWGDDKPRAFQRAQDLASGALRDLTYTIPVESIYPDWVLRKD